MRAASPPLLAYLLLTPALLSCAEDEPETYDPAEILAQSVEFEDNLERLTADQLLTIHDDASMTNTHIWADPTGAQLFRTIDIDDPTQEIEFPPGTIFVKDAYDLDGNPLDQIFVLAKFEQGYNPAGNDWFFALIGRDGSVMREGKGQEVEFCRDCHSSMAPNTDHVIGIPQEQLTP